MTKFITFREVRTHTLNGNLVEDHRDLAVNIDHITHIYPVIGEEGRSLLCLSDEESTLEVEGNFTRVVDYLNKQCL